jgi:Icc-related predicted phosphoesterase
MALKIVAISDTHGFHKGLTIPDGDMLICAGDFSMRAEMKHVVEFAQWFNSHPHKHKVVVAGNHDMYCEGERQWTKDEFFPAIYLVHEEAEVNGYRVFGSPYSSCIFVPSAWSFDYDPKGPRSEGLWSQIPDNLDILITHGPPKGILDKVDRTNPREDEHVGDVNLLYHVKRALPRAHIFGHIHEGAGSYISDLWTTKFYNACVCNGKYKPMNPVTVFDL